MGTSKSINPSVSGDPNWGDLSRSVTSASRSNHPNNKQLSRIMNNFVNAVGGANRAGGGKSKVFGKAGILTVNNLLKFISDVQNTGLQNNLENIGIPNASEASVNDIINYLINYCTGESTSLDETAAKSANNKLIEQLLNVAKNINDVETILNSIDADKSEQLICDFFANYIMEFSTQLLNERILNKENGSKKRRIFNDIKHFVQEMIKDINFNKNLTNVNWDSDEGLKIIKSIQQKILGAFE